MARRLKFDTTPVKPGEAPDAVAELKAATAYFRTGEDEADNYLHFDEHFEVILKAAEEQLKVLASKEEKSRVDFLTKRDKHGRPIMARERRDSKGLPPKMRERIVWNVNHHAGEVCKRNHEWQTTMRGFLMLDDAHRIAIARCYRLEGDAERMYGRIGGGYTATLSSLLWAIYENGGMEGLQSLMRVDPDILEAAVRDPSNDLIHLT